MLKVQIHFEGISSGETAGIVLGTPPPNFREDQKPC